MFLVVSRRNIFYSYHQIIAHVPILPFLAIEGAVLELYNQDQLD